MNLTTTLRPSYQLPMFNEIPKLLSLYKWLLVQSPAGSGKSVLIAHLCARIMAAGKIPLVLTHRGKIQLQLIGHCDGVSIDAKVDHLFISVGHTYVAMQQTLANRPAILSQLLSLNNKLVIIADEAHFGIFKKTFDLLPDAYRIGFSATPAWKWAKWLPDYYKALLPGPQISTLIQEGSLVNFDYYEMQSNLDGLDKNKQGEFTEESQFKVFGQASIYDDLQKHLRDWSGKYKKGVIFCSSIKHANKLHEQLQSEFNCVKYHSEMGKDGSYEMGKFTDLNLSNLMITVSALAEGWDYPALDFVVLYRATSSLPLFIQMGMRASRPCTGKTHATVLDFGGNHSRHKSMIMDRDWEVLWRPPDKVPKSGGGVAPICNCPSCDMILFATAKSCFNCGFMFPDKEYELKKGELVRIQEQAEADRLTVQGRRISTLSPIELAYYAKAANKSQFAVRVARSHYLTQLITNGPEMNWLHLFGAAMASLHPGKYEDKWLNYQLRTLEEERHNCHLQGVEMELPYADILVNVAKPAALIL